MSLPGRPKECIFSTWAPGRVNLIGEHTDYSGGLVLPAAIDLGIRIDVHAEASTIEVYSELLGQADSVAVDGSGRPVTGWARYVQAVAHELAQKGRRPIGIRATVSSTLPTRAGLSSSAALEVSLALALCTVADLALEPLELAALCRRAEFRAVGVPCGILDPAASILGQEGQAVLLNCGTLSHQLVAIPQEASLLVVDASVERSLEDTGYAERKSELEHALALVGSKTSTAIRSSDLSTLKGVARRRVRHVFTENARVKRFAQALNASDLAAAGALLIESHTSLRDDYEVSTPELDLIAEQAVEAGAYGARLVGGGFGGSVLALAERARANEIASAIVSALSSSRAVPARVLEVRPRHGARVQLKTD